MANPLNLQSSMFDMLGQTQAYRAKHAGQIRNPDDIRTVGGLDIDVSGQGAFTATTQQVTPGKGVRTFKPAPPSSLLSPELRSAALQTQMNAPAQAALDKARNQSVEGTVFEGTAIQDSVEIRRTPYAPQTIMGPGYQPGPPGSREATIAVYGEEIARQGDAARAETELAKTYGQDVKVAYDPLGDGYLMLRPGQSGYDDVMSARDALAQTGRDIGKLGLGDAFNGLLSTYGIKV